MNEKCVGCGLATSYYLSLTKLGIALRETGFPVFPSNFMLPFTYGKFRISRTGNGKFECHKSRLKMNLLSSTNTLKQFGSARLCYQPIRAESNIQSLKSCLKQSSELKDGVGESRNLSSEEDLVS